MCGRKRDDGIDVAVLVATRELVASNGYSNFSVEAVAARLGIAKSTVYKRWPSRQQLLAVALAEHLREVPLTANQSLDGSFRARLVAALDTEIQLVASPEGRAVVQAVFESVDDKQDRGILELALASRRAALANILAGAMDSGHIAAGTDVELLASILFGATWGSALAGLPAEGTAAELVDVILTPAIVA